MTMLERVIAFTLKNKNAVIFFAILAAVLGVFSYTRLPIDAFPDVTNVQVEIVCNAEGLSAQEIERFVTHPIEMSMRGLPGIDQMRSVTKFGIAVVTVVFQDQVDIYFARQLVFEKLSEASKNVPEGVEVTLGPIATAMGEIFQYTLHGKRPEEGGDGAGYLTELRTLQDWVITPMLKSVPGVTEINSFGGFIRQYHVIVNPDRLLAHGLTIEDVERAVRENNRNVGGNVLERFSEQLIVRGIGMLRSEEDIRKIVLKTESGVPVFVRDVADVAGGQSIRQGAAMENGRECVGGIVMMLRGENSRDVVRRVQAKVKEINENRILPEGIRIEPYYQRSEIVGKSIETVSKALGEGAILVVVILYVFLRSIRGAIIVLLALPLSILLTFIVMKNAGIDANLMSLGGLAISIGMIVDTTIIQVENVQRHLSQKGRGGNAFSAILSAVLEVRKPSILGELIICVTFFPILSLQGLEGKMFTPLALTVMIALLSSLVLSIFVIPVLCFVFLKSEKEKESPVLNAARRIYLPALRWSMKKKRWVIGAAVVLLAVVCVLIPRLGTEFIPIMDEGAFDMDVQMLSGVSLDQALATARVVQERLGQFPELKTVVSRTGPTGIALEARGTDKTGYVGVFEPRSEWKNAKDQKDLIDQMRNALSDIPGMVFTFSQPIQCRIDELVAGTKAQLIVKLFGEDMDSLKAKAVEIGQVLSQIEGTTDLIVEQTSGQPTLSIEVDRDKIARHGLNVNDVLDAVQTAVGGTAATQMYESNRSFDVTVRFPEERRNSPDAIGKLLLKSAGGYLVPLHQLADITVGEGPAQISRQDGQRRIGIELNVRGRDIGGFVSEARSAVREKVRLPSGYYLTWGGQFENQQRAMKRLAIILPLGIALIFLLLFVTFNSVRLAGLVILNLPFALIGGVLALFLSGQYLSVPASVGFIVLFGVAVLNGVVLVSYIAQLRGNGVSLEEAIQKGCRDRLRPVLMTASISIFSLIPMLFSTGPGSEIQRPLATVVIGGLVTSTLLTLVILPSLYGWFEGKARPSD
jgi:cobalt-zinc-cadmium resistance protein CzcA